MMGMDYKFAGSSLCSRFDDEMKGIVELFGGKMVSERQYEMPECTPLPVVKWVNAPYGDFDDKETRAIYEFMKPKLEQVRSISDQIVYELECCVRYHKGWDIY